MISMCVYFVFNAEQYSKLLEGAFFDAEVEMEGNSLCHDRICTNSVHEQRKASLYSCLEIPDVIAG